MPIQPDDDDPRRLRILLVVVLLATLAGGSLDLYLDGPDDWRSFHALYEVGLISFAVIVMGWLWGRWFRSRQALAETRQQFAEQVVERDAWRRSAEAALAGMAAAIDTKLRAWGLTDAERDVANGLLKGRSHKQIAFDTGRSERTVRQHAVAVYQKSGLRGRAELAAFFLEGLP